MIYTRVHIVLLMLIFGFLAACASDPDARQNSQNGNTPSYQRPSRSAEPRPDQKPNFEYNDSSQDLMDPMQAHLRARKQVNPRDTRSRRSYTKKTTPYKTASNSRTAGGSSRSSSKTSRSQTRSKPSSSASGVPIPGTKPFAGTSQRSSVRPPLAAAPASRALTPPRKPQISSSGVTQFSTTVKPLGAKPMQITKSANDGGMVQDVRIGSYPDKTRIVFDMDRPISYKTAMATNGRSMIIKFSGANWGTHTAKSYANDPLLSKYKTSLQNNNMTTVLTFKRPVKLVSSHTYPPNDTYNGYRAVLDFVAN